MTTWKGHWHGYGPWTGRREDLAVEHLRRPGPDLSRPDPNTTAFIRGELPPMQTGHALLRKPARDRTWTDLNGALTWLEKTYVGHPPGDGQATDLVGRLAYARQFLAGGSDDVLAYYTAGFSFVHYEIICCPNRFHPSIVCPA
jgi:hypothetical protein